MRQNWGVRKPIPNWMQGVAGLVGVALVVAIAYFAIGDGNGEAVPAEWRVDPAADVGPEALLIPIQVLETECSGGETAHGRLVPTVQHATDTIAIDIGVRTLDGDQSCPGNPVTPFVVELDDPLGDRSITGDLWTSP